jgi:hypothetical protein
MLEPTIYTVHGVRLDLQLFMLLCLGVSFAVCPDALADEPKEATEDVYVRWITQYEGKSIRADEQDPVFLDLLERTDGDLFFLRGLRGSSNQVRTLSRIALGRLKTDRSFEKLAPQTKDKDVGVRKIAVQALGEFRQQRCVPILLGVLIADSDRELKSQAANLLANFPEPRIEPALLKALEEGRPISPAQAGILSEMQIGEAIEPTFQLLLATKDGRTQEIILAALLRHNRKQAIRRLLDFQDHLLAIGSTSSERMLRVIQNSFRRLTREAGLFNGPLPETPEQYREWWTLNELSFSDDLRLLTTDNFDDFPADQRNVDPEQLKFSISIDAKTYRVGDPIAVDFSMQNKSDRPTRTIPPVTSGWRPTMAYGVRLTRLGDFEETLIATEPTDFYIGSYSGPPHFENLKSNQNFIRRDCLHNWLHMQRQELWPLAEGTYKLCIVFDNRKFAFAHAKPGEILHRWEAPPVEFSVDGPARTDPQELLKLIGEKSKMKWLEADLTSQTLGRSAAAWKALRVWGDDRLKPLFRDRETYDRYLQEGRPLSHFKFDPAKPAQ